MAPRPLAPRAKSWIVGGAIVRAVDGRVTSVREHRRGRLAHDVAGRDFREDVGRPNRHGRQRVAMVRRLVSSVRGPRRRVHARTEEREGDPRRIVPLRSEGVSRLPRLGARPRSARYGTRPRRLPVRDEHFLRDHVIPFARSRRLHRRRMLDHKPEWRHGRLHSPVPRVQRRPRVPEATSATAALLTSGHPCEQSGAEKRRGPVTWRSSVSTL